MRKCDGIQEARLKAALAQSFVFSGLAGEDLTAVILAFQENRIVSGTTVMARYDFGAH